MSTQTRLVTGLFLFLALAVPVRADFIDLDFIDARAEVLEDGWLRYTYTVEKPLAKVLESFVLTSEFLDEIRNITQPEDWIGYAMDDRLSWGRDAYRFEWECKAELLEFSFESPALPDLVSYRARGFGYTRRGMILGPGLTPVAEPTETVKTPEPTSLGLLGLGGGLWLLTRRFRREPA